MTVILILGCLVIGGAELYMARSARRTADRLEKLEAIAVLQDERIESVSARLGEGVRLGGDAPDLDKRLKTSIHRIDTELARLTGETSKLRDRVATFADAYGRDQRLHQKMIRAIEALERTVADVLEHTLYRLDRAVSATLGDPPGDGDTARGVVCGGGATSHEALTRGYERCAADAGLRVRFRAPGTGEPRHTRYYLTGKDPRELERDFRSLLGAVRPGGAAPGSVRPDTAAPGVLGPDTAPQGAVPMPRGETAFQGLLRALEGVDAGFVQIGPMVAARTPDVLLCGVLTLAECRGFDTVALAGDPAAVAGRLRALPAERVRDLREEPLLLVRSQPEPE